MKLRYHVSAVQTIATGGRIHWPVGRRVTMKAADRLVAALRPQRRYAHCYFVIERDW